MHIYDKHYSLNLISRIGVANYSPTLMRILFKFRKTYLQFSDSCKIVFENNFQN